jgi:plastocyanin domain-containing protein
MRASQLIIAISLGSLLALTGCKKKAPPAPHGSGSGTVAVTVDENGFKPDSVTFAKGVPATLVFTRKTDDTCARVVVFPELDIKKDLPLGYPISIPIPTDKPQKLTFQCGMGMYKSSVVIN